MLHFFGEDGQKKLDLAAFNAFLEGLHAEIDRLEFQHYDPQGSVRDPRLPSKAGFLIVPLQRRNAAPSENAGRMSRWALRCRGT
jgi:hypothetical protein